VDHEAEGSQLITDFLFVDIFFFFLVPEVIKKKELQLWIIETTLSWENKRHSPTDLLKVDFYIGIIGKSFVSRISPVVLMVLKEVKGKRADGMATC